MARAVSSVIGVVLLVFLTLVLAASVGVVLTTPTHEPAPVADFSVTADAGGQITITHEGGETVPVSTLDVTIEVNGNELAHQPPVPFFAARGFESGPTGPFNSASDDRWQAGERAGLRLAATNSPSIERGADVSVTIATERAVIAREKTTVM